MSIDEVAEKLPAILIRGHIMNLSQLQYFKVLAQEEHYTRAAQMLAITQPSLSHAIAQLEQELGTRLFEKKGRNVVLTRYGKMFLPYVEESLKVLDEGVQRVKEVNGSKEGIIHLAYIYTMGSEFTPRIVRKFLDTYPDYNIDFHFTVGTTGEIIEGLKEDKYDIIFSSYQDGEPDIDFKKIGNQKLVLAVPQDHPLSIKDSVDLRDTIEFPQIYFEKGSGLRPVIDQMYEEIGQFPKVAFEMEEDSSMAGLVAQGFGIAVMPDIPILKSLGVKTLDIYNPSYERAVYLATLKKHYLSPVAKAFIRFVCEETS